MEYLPLACGVMGIVCSSFIILLNTNLVYKSMHPVGHEVKAQLSVTSLPDLLFGESNTRNIVEGSVIWLYCEVNSSSSTLSVMWNKDGESQVQDVPHIILRNFTSSSSSTLLLVVDNVVSSDAGLYQCAAQDGQFTATGNALDITGY